ncbi:hypothetical protein [Pseudomonas marginalis]|uniref:hypothetical protein n=1 Tax=Pseudomonas marginalis TaxID=298 RepID=UPI003BA39E27
MESAFLRSRVRLKARLFPPSLANIYLYYVMDFWIKQWRERNEQGQMIAVRYANDSVLGFEKHQDV